MWITYKPYLANKHSSGESKIALTKRGESVTKVNKIVKAYSPYSASITDSLDLFNRSSYQLIMQIKHQESICWYFFKVY